MEENPAALDCLICFYIDMKHLLKTRLLNENLFIQEMIEHCKERGFHGYSDKDIENTWIKVVSKYVYLKAKGSVKDREGWNYFKIFDSCYEQSDFQVGADPKFSEEMVWFLIECIFKRRSLRRQKHSSLFSDIHKDFLLNGYLHITRHDIETKWKNLTLEYDKLKSDPKKLKELPYLQALKIVHKKNGSQPVNMAFTKDLTESLIECFTKNKISCIIYGYESDRILNETQWMFKGLGFNFSKDAIKEKWRKLTNIYEFLVSRKIKQTSWIYFNAMGNYFKDNYLSPCKTEGKEKIIERNVDKPKTLRQRSKSVCTRVGRSDWENSHLTVKPENEKHPSLATSEDEQIHVIKNRSVKRPFEDLAENYCPKKLKTRSRARKSTEINREKNMSEINVINLRSGMHLRPRSKSVCLELRRIDLEKPSLGVEPEKSLDSKKKSGRKPKVSGDANNSNRTLRIRDPVNANELKNAEKLKQSCIDEVNGTSTVDLPSITKQFSENELLPLKKRLRADVEDVNRQTIALEDIEGGTVNQLSTTDERRCATKAVEIIRKTFENNESNDKLQKPVDDSESKNYQFSHNSQSQKTSKEELQKDIPTQNITPQNPLMVVVKMDGSCKFVKRASKDAKITDSLSSKQVIEETSVKPLGSKSSSLIHPETKKLVSVVDVNRTEASTVYNSEEVPNSTDTTDIQIVGYIPSTNEVLTCHTNVNNDRGEVPNGNSDCYATETEQNERHIQNETSGAQNAGIVFRQPLPVVEKTIDLTTSSDKLLNTKRSRSKRNQITSVKVTAPPKSTGEVKKISISPQKLNQIVKPAIRTQICKKNGMPNMSVKRIFSDFKFVSQIIKPAATKNSTEDGPDKTTNFDLEVTNTDDNCSVEPVPLPLDLASDLKFPGTSSPAQIKSDKNEEFETESVFSEAVGDDGLKDNLLATVIDFQEQNNQEFIEIKNLMKQNNLLQRETNRLLRLLLEKK